MPKHFSLQNLRADQLHSDRPVSELFLNAVTRYLEDPDSAEIRTVVARNVHVPEGFEATAKGLRLMRPGFEELRLFTEEMMTPICVLERSDGSLWAYDDAHLITLYHQLAPARRVRCAIIGSDPGCEATQ